MRVIAGSRKGHRIDAPRGLTTRPTSDRVRENVFNLVQAWVEDAVVLDLFAGSGAMGIEALSRGAERAVFVESQPEACRAIEHNLDKLRLIGAQVVCTDVMRFVAADTREYDLVFCDPPYDDYPALEPAIARYLPRLLIDDGLLALETAAKTEPQLPLGQRTSRRYGSARITLFHR
jgi:16S rRNA (guanine966-N2)-methyltransferase